MSLHTMSVIRFHASEECPMPTNPGDFSAADRKRYEEDTYGWLQERFAWVNRRMIEQSESEASHAKEFVQNASESLARSLAAVHYSLILWLGLIAIVALASARVWYGVAGVALILECARWRHLRATRALFLVDRFRTDCYRHLLEVAEGFSTYGPMLEEDKELVLKFRDSVLYPLAVKHDMRKAIGSHDLEAMETLYREYRSCHMCNPDGPQCDLCAARERVRVHVQSVVSKYENQIKVAHTKLATAVDGQNSEGAIEATVFLQQYRKWERWRRPDDSEPESVASSLTALSLKENWTFAEADEVRELCRKESRDRGFWAHECAERAKQMFDVLTQKIEQAAAEFGAIEHWHFYDQSKNWSLDWNRFPRIRRALARRNPETMVRELTYPNSGDLLLVCREYLQPLTEYGFDLEMVTRELKAAWRVVRKEDRERKEDQRMFSAARRFFELRRLSIEDSFPHSGQV